MIPKLRFPGFNGEWEAKKLGDVVQFKNGRPFEDDVDVDGRYKLITIDSVDIEGNLKSKFKRVNRSDKSLMTGDLVLVLSDIAHGHLLGLTAPIPSDEFVLNQRMGRLRALNGSHMSFLRYCINQHQLFFRKRGQGTSQRHIYEKDVTQLPIVIPANNEQRKIAEFMDLVNERIAAMGKKVELLQQYKKGVMQKIFTQKLRFRDENGADYPNWETKKLGEVAQKVNSPISANEIENRSGKYKVYGASGLLQTLDSYDQAEEYTAIVKDGAGVGRLIWCEAESSVLSTLNIIKPKVNNDGKFLHYLLQTFDFTKYSTGSTIPHVYFRDYAKQSIVVPSPKEQKKIADFLTSLDDKINLEKTKLEEAKLFKRSLQQRMFV